MPSLHGYTPLTVYTDLKNNKLHAHTMLIGPLREPKHGLPLDSTLHVAHLPLDVSEEQVRSLFQVCGPISQVRLPEPISQVGGEGFVVFESMESLGQLDLVRAAASSWPAEKALSMGVSRYQKRFVSLRGEPGQFEKMAKEALQLYDVKKKEEEKRAKQQEMNQDGFTLVKGQKRNKQIPLKETPLAKFRKSDFYQFQAHEKKINQLKELKDKFEDDKKKLLRRQGTRKFQPH